MEETSKGMTYLHIIMSLIAFAVLFLIFSSITKGKLSSYISLLFMILIVPVILIGKYRHWK